MIVTRDIQIDKKNLLLEVSKYLQIKMPLLKSISLEESIKELCVFRLCKTIGLRCEYNYKSKFFDFFARIVAEAVCQNLSIPLHIAEDELRLFRYDNANIIEHVKTLLHNVDKDEAFVDIFDFVDKYKYLIGN